MAVYFVSSISRSKGGVFHFDSETGALELLLPGRFRGITRAGDGWIYAVTGTRRHIAGELTRIYRLLPETGESEEVAVLPWKACHDLRWYGDSFYMAASVGNTVVRFDSGFTEVDRLQLVPDPGDVCHVNCLAERDAELYASVFTLSPGTREEKRQTSSWLSEGKIVRLDFARGGFEVCHEPLAQPHSLNWRDGRLFLVESHTSHISEIDLETGRARRVAQLGGFVRGMAVGTDDVVVGACPLFREERGRSAKVPWLTRFTDRFAPFAGLMVLERETWKVRGRFPVVNIEPYDIISNI